MSEYYVIRDKNSTKSYQYKTTHTGYPYICVNKTNYLDLTTETKTGLNARFKIGGGTKFFYNNYNLI